MVLVLFYYAFFLWCSCELLNFFIHCVRTLSPWLAIVNGCARESGHISFVVDIAWIYFLLFKLLKNLEFQANFGCGTLHDCIVNYRCWVAGDVGYFVFNAVDESCWDNCAGVARNIEIDRDGKPTQRMNENRISGFWRMLLALHYRAVLPSSFFLLLGRFFVIFFNVVCGHTSRMI